MSKEKKDDIVNYRNIGTTVEDEGIIIKYGEYRNKKLEKDKLRGIL